MALQILVSQNDKMRKEFANKVNTSKENNSNIKALALQANKVCQTMEIKKCNFNQALAWDLPDIQRLFLYYDFLSNLNVNQKQNYTIFIKEIFLIVINYLASVNLSNDDLSRMMDQTKQLEHKRREQVYHLTVHYQCSGLFFKDNKLLQKIRACEQARSEEELKNVLSKQNNKSSIVIEEVKDDTKGKITKKI